MINHRGTCEDPDCGRIWRENCEDCLREVTDRHRDETGHGVHLTITPDGESPWTVRKLAAMANHGVLPLPRRRMF